MEDLWKFNEEIAMQTFQRIGLLKEVEGPENPGALEKRVALAPDEVRKLVDLL